MTIIRKTYKKKDDYNNIRGKQLAQKHNGGNKNTHQDGTKIAQSTKNKT